MPRSNADERREYSRLYNLNRRRNDSEFAARIKDSNRRSAEKLAGQCRELLAEFRIGGCKYCGEQDSCCLDAHHRDPSQKEFSIASYRRSVGIEKFKAELAKCDCVCRNCHAKIHSGTIPS